MIANDIDGLLLQITNLPGVHESAILPSTLTTLACEIDSHQLSHSLGEDVRSLHTKLVKEKHSHFTNIAFGKIGSRRRPTRFLQTLVCRGPLVSIRGRHGGVTLGGISITRILSIGTRGAFIVIAWEAKLQVVVHMGLTLYL